jgi:hypothetical protein
MYEQFLVRKDSLENVVENGRITGFKFGVRIADYRGVFLSLHNGYYIKMDGIEYPRETQRIELNGKGPRSFEETKKCVWEHWNYDDEAIIYVTKEGGLTDGLHTLAIQQSILNSYGYLPMQQEWVTNPPTPGQGIGAGKTAVICEYELELQQEGKEHEH